ncbi:unnamed protein product, partial [Arabidopsis halleri]
GVPEIFSDLVGREFEFEIKITDYNFRSEYETFTVSRTKRQPKGPKRGFIFFFFRQTGFHG